MLQSFLELAKDRYSCRSFSSEPVASSDLKQILQAACLAPSAVNTQSCQLCLVTDPVKMRKMNELRNWFGAAALIIVCIPAQASWTRAQDHQNFILTDLGILIDHMALCTTSLGLGSCIIGSFDSHAIQRTLGIPDNLYPMAVLALGHPSAEAAPGPMHSNRKSIAQRLVPGSDQP